MDKFDSAREKIWGTPGFQSRRSTITSPAFLGYPLGDWIIETVRNDETWGAFLRFIGPEGSLRIVLPGKVVEAMARHRESIIKVARKHRAQNAARTRESKVLKKLE